MMCQVRYKGQNLCVEVKTERDKIEMQLWLLRQKTYIENNIRCDSLVVPPCVKRCLIKSYKNDARP
jgi:hypothetical protein